MNAAVTRMLARAVPRATHMHATRMAAPAAALLTARGAASTPTISSEEAIALDGQYGAHNYHPLPVVFSKAQGAEVWDPEGRHYFDFLAAYSACNQGHSHPKIVQALVDQASKCALSSRAFHNDVFGRYAKYVTEYFGHDMVLPMNTGAEGVETALKLARKWAYMKKGVPENEAIIVTARECFHGRTLAIVSFSTDPEARAGFGPFLPGLLSVDYNDADALERVLAEHGDKVAAFLVEPIQGEAGVIVPDDGYLSRCKALCEQHNVLMVADEIQTGIARTGKMLACDHDAVKPDMLILGKALAGGVYPVSAVLTSKDVMLCIKPGEHGSTYGGNPLGSAVAMAALDVVKEEGLVERSAVLGAQFREALRAANAPCVRDVRGKGLMNALEVHSDFSKSAWDICMLLKERGVLAKPTHDHTIRFTPPLVITDAQMAECTDIITRSLHDVETQ